MRLEAKCVLPPHQTNTWRLSELRITAAQAEFLSTGRVAMVSLKVAALTEDSLARRKMLSWKPGRDGFYLGANAKGKAALEQYHRREARRYQPANDNRRIGEQDAA